jgi:hypothetical protein
LGKSAVPRAPIDDFVGYEILVGFMRERALHSLEGDIVEIGAFMGGGTIKLARYAKKHGRRVYAIDNFDPSCDRTEDISGVRMCDIYRALLGGRSLEEVYREATRGFDNIITINQDSQEVRFPEEQRFILGFIDGNHQPEYVINDFHIVWPNLVSGGALGFHDYNHGLPQLTEAIDGLIAEHKDEIGEVSEIGDRHIILLIRR